ncbi:hypothetical protein PV797_05310 [Clostridiaceae bacterium M8S5]|nr:hypothetical protein PV797_05310 [Clostridiaceae bacterium M8S5]
MKLIDIKKATLDKLTASFPDFNIHGEDKVTDMSKTTLTVQLNPIYMDIMDKYNRRQYVNLSVRIYSTDKTNDANIDIVDKLYKIFDATIEVKNRKLHIKTIRIMKENDILKCSFNINYEDEVETTENYVLMKELNIKEEY